MAAFLVPSSVRVPQVTPQASLPRPEGRTSSEGRSVAPLAAVALLAASSCRQRKALVKTLVRAEKFAGGLIGGESAFAGQDFNFDPLGLSVKCEKYLPWFREAELKHGRIAMLGFVGLVVPEFLRVPGTGACYEAKTVVEAHNACAGDPCPGCNVVLPSPLRYFPFLINSLDFYGNLLL